jgi:hypothetical protein
MKSTVRGEECGQASGAACGRKSDISVMAVSVPFS